MEAFYIAIAYCVFKEILHYATVDRLENKLMSRNFFEYQHADSAADLQKARLKQPIQHMTYQDPDVDLANRII